MVKVYIVILMATNFKEIFKMTNLMERVKFGILMEITMKDRLRTIREKVMEFISIKMEIFIQVIGRMI